MSNLLPALCFGVFIIGLVAGGFMLFTRSLEIVPEGSVAIVERGGEFRGVLNPGRHLLMPLDRIRALVELQEFSTAIHADTVITQNATIIALGYGRELSNRALYTTKSHPRPA